jgi:hypothetical protein
MADDPMTFWSEHNPAEVFAAVDALLGKSVKCRLPGQFKGHHILHIGYPEDFDLSALEPQLRQDLDAIGWQFVTTGTRLELRVAGEIPSFGVAPILLRSVPVAYQATRACIIPLILKDGLLPSNADRRATAFPDTEGVIHACAKLTHTEAENDSAEWWRQELSKKNRFNDPHWGIVQIDLTGLRGARVHQDMHSKSGLIIDRVDRVPPDLVRQVG